MTMSLLGGPPDYLLCVLATGASTINSSHSQPFTNFTIAHTITSTMWHFVHVIPIIYLNFSIGKLDMVIFQRYNDKFALGITQER